MALAPNFPTNPYVYVLYTYDAADRRHGARAGTTTVPTPPGPTTDGCVVSGRLSRFQASGDVSTGPEQVLINDWCQQFPSHSIGTVAFGPDGALYVSGGDGASFNFADYGQAGGTLAGTPTPVNPCSDPASEGGALRSQDIRTMPTGGGGGGSYAATVLADAPVGYWRLGEASGTSAADEIGAHNGTYVGSPTRGVTGIPGAGGNTAMTLNGSGSGYVTTSWSAAPAAPASVEAWIRHAGSDFTIDTTIAGAVRTRVACPAADGVWQRLKRHGPRHLHRERQCPLRVDASRGHGLAPPGRDDQRGRRDRDHLLRRGPEGVRWGGLFGRVDDRPIHDRQRDRRRDGRHRVVAGLHRRGRGLRLRAEFWSGRRALRRRDQRRAPAVRSGDPGRGRSCVSTRIPAPR